jgi:hypothetical protein
MPIQRSKKIVDELVTAKGTKTADTPALFQTHEFLSEIEQRTKDMGTYCYDYMATCRGTGYDHREHLVQMWHIGLVVAEYAAGLMADKARIGHCHSTGKTNQCCLKGRLLHLKMLVQFNVELGKLIEEIKALEDDAPNWPKADNHPDEKP